MFVLHLHLLCVVFVLHLHPLNLFLKINGMLNRKHPKTPSGCAGRILAAVGAALCIELSVGPAVSTELYRRKLTRIVHKDPVRTAQ